MRTRRSSKQSLATYNKLNFVGLIGPASPVTEVITARLLEDYLECPKPYLARVCGLLFERATRGKFQIYRYGSHDGGELEC